MLQARVGICHVSNEGFWFQVIETILAHVKDIFSDVIDFKDIRILDEPNFNHYRSFLEEIMIQELDVLIGWTLPTELVDPILETGLPIVYLYEVELHHPLLSAPRGLQKGAEDITQYLVQQIPQQANVLVAGGSLQAGVEDNGHSRLTGITNVLHQYPSLNMHHIPLPWRDYHSKIQDYLDTQTQLFDAIIGVSDPIALYVREAALARGMCQEDTPVVGFNGDSDAIAAIINQKMLATVEISPSALAQEAVKIARLFITGDDVPETYDYQLQLISKANVAQVASEKLLSIAKLPTVLANNNVREQQEQILELETSLALCHEISAILSESELITELNRLLWESYQYDIVQLVSWDEEIQIWQLSQPALNQPQSTPVSDNTSLFTQVLSQDEIVLIPDLSRSLRFEPDPDWADTRTRILIPVHQQDQVVSLLDIHSKTVKFISRHHLIGLQALANQVGVVLQNIRNYQHALLQNPETIPTSDINHDQPPHKIEIQSETEWNSPLSPQTRQLVEQAKAYIAEHFALPLTRHEIAEELSISENYLTQIFRQGTNSALWEYVNHCRIDHAKQMLMDSNFTIAQVATRVGFDDPAYFSRVFRRYVGLSPRAFRRQ